jgi:hypothetical protein
MTTDATKDKLYQAVLAAFQMNLDQKDDVPAAARAVANILTEFASAIAPAYPLATIDGLEMSRDETPGLILTALQELRGELKKTAFVLTATARHCMMGVDVTAAGMTSAGPDTGGGLKPTAEFMQRIDSIRSAAAARYEEWRIQIEGETYYFNRYINGSASETYRSVCQAEAAVWVAAIIQGFEPPRRLNVSDRPAGGNPQKPVDPPGA